jgi:hypothetical protein
VIGDISNGDDEDSDQNEESEEEVATAVGCWRLEPVRDYISCGYPLINKLAVAVGSQSLPSLLIAV